MRPGGESLQTLAHHLTIGSWPERRRGSGVDLSPITHELEFKRLYITVRTQLVLLALLAVVASAGCTMATERNDWSTYTGPGAAHFQAPEYELPLVPDPLEPSNRVMGGINKVVLLWVIDPLSTAWRFIVPQVVRDHLVLAARNLGYPGRAVNNLLQGKFKEAGDETLRFLANTTVGMLGLFDPATEWGIPASRENTGRTLATWGWHDSTYLTLPIIGPSTTRDTLGFAGDLALDPTTYFFPARPIKGFIQGSEAAGEVTRFVRTNQDPYGPARLMWVRGREILPRTFSYDYEDNSATQSLQSLSLSTDDPWFPYKSRTRKVDIAATGRKMSYDLWMQPDPAPMVFVLPGLGSHRQSRQAVTLAEMVHRRGFSVATISSPMNFDFMQTAATVALPGFAPADARDVHAALDAVNRDLTQRYGNRITARALLGLSQGAFHTLYIAAGAQDVANELLDFDRYVCLYPPVRLDHAAGQFDAFYNTLMEFPPEERDPRAVQILQKAIRGGLAGVRAPSHQPPFSQTEAEFLVGLGFRVVLHDMIWVSQIREDMGVLKTPLKTMQRAVPASREILDFSYMEYFYAFLLPYFKGRDGGPTTVRQMLDRNDARCLTDGLRASGKIRVFTNDNDFLLRPQDLEWLRDVLGAQNVTVFAGGGHVGNLHQPEVQEHIMQNLGDLRGY